MSAFVEEFQLRDFACFTPKSFVNIYSIVLTTNWRGVLTASKKVQGPILETKGARVAVSYATSHLWLSVRTVFRAGRWTASAQFARGWKDRVFGWHYFFDPEGILRLSMNYRPYGMVELG